MNYYQRFWSKVSIPRGMDGCWKWQGTKDWQGFGRFPAHFGTRVAHRIAYEIMFGELPDVLVLDHLCCNRSCVNPFHLEPVTRRENIIRGVKRTTGKPRLHKEYDWIV